jgi:(p)ppGpp synthase/HD superfamily hydrolase
MEKIREHIEGNLKTAGRAYDDASYRLEEAQKKLKMDDTFKNLREIARKQYNDSNCRYGDNEYIFHIDMVVDFLTKHIAVFKSLKDAENTLNASLFHDSIEDAKQTYNNIKDVAGKDIADITLSVTDVPAENRLMKHLLTMGKTVRDYRAIILKMADIYSNAKYSKESGSSMYPKYVAEYLYRRPIFGTALIWYRNDLNEKELLKIFMELDEIHIWKQQ